MFVPMINFVDEFRGTNAQTALWIGGLGEEVESSDVKTWFMRVVETIPSFVRRRESSANMSYFLIGLDAQSNVHWIIAKLRVNLFSTSFQFVFRTS